MRRIEVGTDGMRLCVESGREQEKGRQAQKSPLQNWLTV
jgi:hypothetical protein